MKKLLLIVSVMLVSVSLACSISGQQAANPVQTQSETGGGEVQPGPTQVSPTSQPETSVVTQVIIVTATPEPTEFPSKPVSIRSGLNSLNSYAMTIHVVNTGPTLQDVSDNKMEIRYSSDQDAQELHQTMRSSSADDPQAEVEEITTYRVRLEQCTVSSGEYQYESISPAQQEMTNVMLEMLDMTPIISNPVLVGAELVNDIETNHFTFKVSGFGASSGAQVLTNQGEYWLAVDGRYIVKYSLMLAMQDSDGQQMGLEVYIEMTQVNQPVEIAMPEACR